jgi:glycerate dehydrogenase
MRKSAFLLNTSRGGLIDEAALAAALNQGLLAGAALDVVSQEPIRADNPLLQARNCILTPHLAWATEAARRRLIEETARNLAAFKEGRPRNVVNGD